MPFFLNASISSWNWFLLFFSVFGINKLILQLMNGKLTVHIIMIKVAEIERDDWYCNHHLLLFVFHPRVLLSSPHFLIVVGVRTPYTSYLQNLCFHQNISSTSYHRHPFLILSILKITHFNPFSSNLVLTLLSTHNI